MRKTCVVCKGEFEPAPQNEHRQKVCTPASHKCKVTYSKVGRNEYKKVPCDCCRYVYLRKMANQYRIEEEQFIPVNDQKKLLAAARILTKDELYLMVKLTMELCLRINEARDLRPSDFEISRNGRCIVKVNALKQAGHPEYKVRVRRTTFNEAQRYIKENNIAADQTIFPKTDRWYRKLFKGLQETAGVEKPWKFHSLRHTGVSNWLEQARSPADVHKVQEIARHKHFSSTEVYLHSDPEEMDRFVEGSPRRPKRRVR